MKCLCTFLLEIYPNTRCNVINHPFLCMLSQQIKRKLEQEVGNLRRKKNDSCSTMPEWIVSA